MFLQPPSLLLSSLLQPPSSLLQQRPSLPRSSVSFASSSPSYLSFPTSSMPLQHFLALLLVSPNSLHSYSVSYYSFLSYLLQQQPLSSSLPLLQFSLLLVLFVFLLLNLLHSQYPSSDNHSLFYSHSSFLFRHYQMYMSFLAFLDSLSIDLMLDSHNWLNSEWSQKTF